jgi:hypothetical protein
MRASLKLALALVLVLAVAGIEQPTHQKTEQAAKPSGSSLEEIMARPVRPSVEAPWDKDFKSAVEVRDR